MGFFLVVPEKNDQMWTTRTLFLAKRWWCINSVDNIMDFFSLSCFGCSVCILFPNWNMGFKDLCIFYIVLLWRNKVKLNGFCGFNTSAWIYGRFLREISMKLNKMEWNLSDKSLDWPWLSRFSNSQKLSSNSVNLRKGNKGKRKLEKYSWAGEGKRKNKVEEICIVFIFPTENWYKLFLWKIVRIFLSRDCKMRLLSILWEL